MITAKVEYSYGRYNLGYYHLHFYGDNAKRFDNEWHDIEYRKLHTNKRLINDYNALIENHGKFIAEYKAQLKASKKWYRPWYNKTEIALRKQILEEQEKIEKLIEKVDCLDRDCFYSVSELRVKAERFLSENGFILSTASKACSYYSSRSCTEVWTRA